jgi:uncharacterized flavoprotein (TIGR03862 family)
MPVQQRDRRIIVVGGGPAGLMAAETARSAGVHVDLYEQMGSVGRKILIAGKGGLNLTHGEPLERFLGRYRPAGDEIARWIDRFPPEALRAWARGLGIETMVGSSGRVFPADLRAAPLLRGWVRRLRAQGVRFHLHRRWLGFGEAGLLRFLGPEGETVADGDAVVLALGGGSWPRLGADGGWVEILCSEGVAVRALVPANVGFECAWSPAFAERFAGEPVKPVALFWHDRAGAGRCRQGEFVITRHGIEGSLVYAASADLRDAIAAAGARTVWLDLDPLRARESLTRALEHPRGSRSFSEWLRRRTGIAGVRAAVLRELAADAHALSAVALAARIKRLPLTLLRPRPLAEAISSAGGVAFEELDAGLMLRRRPGVFCAGEMLDWEAPTGGYLLNACMASGIVAAESALRWIDAGRPQARTV